MIVKQELLQYIARLIEESPLRTATKPEAARHDVAALLVEQALALSLNEAGERDVYVVKPLLKATLVIAKERADTIADSDALDYPLLAKLKQDYLQTINSLEQMIANMN